MASLQYVAGANFQTGALASAYTAGGTSLTLTSGHGSRFPSSGDFWVRCENEIFKATARSTDTLTVTGAQDGTPAANHAAGAEVYWVLGVAALDQLRSDIVVGGGGGHIIADEGTPLAARAKLDFAGAGVTATDDSAGNRTLVMIPGGGGGAIASMTVTDFQTATSNGTVQGGLSAVRLRDGLYECLWNGSAWEYYHGSIRCDRPLLSSFVDQSGQANTATTTDRLHINITGTANNQQSAKSQTLTVSAPYRLEIGFLMVTGPENYGGAALHLHSTASNKGIYVENIHNMEHTIGFQRSAGRNYASSLFNLNARQILASRSIVFVGIEFNGTAFTPVVSGDGIDWIPYAAADPLASHVANAPDEAAFRCNPSPNFRPWLKILHFKQRAL